MRCCGPGRAACPATTAGSAWCPADLAPLLLPEPLEVPDAGHAPVLEQLAGGQALFFRGLSDLVGATDDTALADAGLGPGVGRAC